MDDPATFDEMDLDMPDLDPEDRQRLDAEWCTANALRETIGIARKGEGLPTYAQAMQIAERLIPALFDPTSSLLVRGRESPSVMEYRQKAEALSILEHRPVTPLEAVNRDIRHHETLVEACPNRYLLEKKLTSLLEVRRQLEPRAYSETQLILRDVFDVERDLPVSGSGHDYRQFELAKGRILRIRMLHPDRPEHSTGADVIYEQYWNAKALVRLVAVQYKIWNGRYLYKNGDVARQIDRLHQAFCDENLCEEFAETRRKNAYRLPYCSAFLRPTDRLQYPNSKLISRGLHIPACVVIRSWEDTQRGGQRIASERIRGEATTHQVFEELFNVNMLGSRWLTFNELGDLYRKHGILLGTEHIVIHAQDFSR